jgi:YegS/Rv2252/BmrU family lipid kinase
VIWNAKAGQKKRGLLAPTGREELERVLSEAGVEAQIIPTESEADAKKAVAREVKAGEKIIVAAGGDGTADLVAKQILDTDVALGILPLGSVMNIARMLGVPRDLPGAARVIAAGQQAEIDVGEANGEVFFEDASVGIQAAVFRYADEWEQGDLGSIVRAVQAAFRYRPRRMELVFDQERRVSTRALMVVISNAPYAGVGMTVAPDARLNDGKFDVVIWEHFSKGELLRNLASISFGRRRYSPHTSTYRAEHVSITASRPLPVRADAEDLGTTPLECRVRPRCLRVIVGPDFADGRVEPAVDHAPRDKEKAAAAVAAAALSSE